MEVKFIGTGSIGALESSASTLVNKEILIDVPNGIVKRIKQLDEDVLKIKVILLTHLHGDHFFDIPFFIFEKYFYKAENETKIYCPRGTEKKIKGLFDIAFPGEYEKAMEIVKITFIEFDKLENEEILDGIFVDAIPVLHGDVEAPYGFIIKENETTVGFSGDSRMCDAINYIVKNSDMSVLDMSLAGDGNFGHMGLNDIEKICMEYKDKIIISTHMHDFTRKEALKRVIKNLIVPEDGLVVTI